MKQKLNPTIIYLLSILGFLCCCIGGAFLGVPAYFMANKKIKAAELNPEDYEGSIQAMKTAKIVALISSIIGIIALIRVLYVMIFQWDQMAEAWEQAMEQARQQQAAQ